MVEFTSLLHIPPADPTDTRIREVIEFRLEEQRLKLFQLESTQRGLVLRVLHR